MLAGYSLVGVYPCAVWKPAAAAPPAVPSLAAAVCTPGHRQLLEDALVANCSCGGYLHASPTLVAGGHPLAASLPQPQLAPPPGPIRAGSRLASSVRTVPYPPVQLYSAAPNPTVVEPCRCRAGAEELVVAAAEPATVGANSPPMLFVPFALQTNYGSHHVSASPGTTSLSLPNGNSVSPSAPMASVAKVRLEFFKFILH